jgi:F-type H+-transporting ATPase subunit a
MTLGSLFLIAVAAARLSAPVPDSAHHDRAATRVAVLTQPAIDAAQTSGTAEVNRQTSTSLGAQVQAEDAAAEGTKDIIMPHITDAHHIEIPWINAEWGKQLELPQWSPVHLGPLVVDLSLTKHVVMMLFAAVLCALTLILAARTHVRHSHAIGRPKGFSTGVEATVLFVRDEVIMKNVGQHGESFVPFLLSQFFFILFANFLGLIPYGSTVTGNISVTATLAVVSFLVIEIAGMRALGTGYFNTIFYWPKDEPLSFMKVALFLILTPVEMLGKFTKPFALAIRLFANMTAGHVIVLAFIGIVFTFGSWFIAPAPIAMAVGIMLLEVLVALLQAYIFTLLTAVFIGQIREAHH